MILYTFYKHPFKDFWMGGRLKTVRRSDKNKRIYDEMMKWKLSRLVMKCK